LRHSSHNGEYAAQAVQFDLRAQLGLAAAVSWAPMALWGQAGSAGCSGAGFTSSTGAGSRCPTHPARNIASAVIKA